MSFKQLNALPYDNAAIADGINFLQNNVTPATLTSVSARYRFRRRWRGFTVQGGKLYYGPLEVIPDNNVRQTLSNLYDDPAFGGRLGRDRLYDKVKDRYLGITKDDVVRFLDNQESYQLHRRVVKGKVVKPIITRRTNQQWQIDLIILKAFKGFNNQYKYILTVIDLFSKFAWAAALMRKKGDAIADALENIILTSGKQPSILQSDNGNEFKNPEMTELMERFGIKQVHSLPYTPQSQGQVENFNGWLKKQINMHFSHTGRKNWRNSLQEFVYNWNTSRSSTTKEQPIDLQDNATPEMVTKTRKLIKKKAQAMLHSQAHEAPLEVGDKVRTSKLTTTKGRKNDLKIGKDKFVENWSREIYTVATRSKNRRYKREQYLLDDANGNRLRKIYWRHNLQKIDEDQLQQDITGAAAPPPPPPPAPAPGPAPMPAPALPPPVHVVVPGGAAPAIAPAPFIGEAPARREMARREKPKKENTLTKNDINEFLSMPLKQVKAFYKNIMGEELNETKLTETAKAKVRKQLIEKLNL